MKKENGLKDERGGVKVDDNKGPGSFTVALLIALKIQFANFH